MKNTEIAAKFREIAKGLKLLGETNDFRLNAYYRAAHQIELLDKELGEVLNQGDTYFQAFMMGHKNLGDKSRAKIVQLLQTGTCPELEETQKGIANLPPDQRHVDEPKSAKKRKASKNIREEVNAVRRPWAQADEVVQDILPVVTGVFHDAIVCGSYRRKLDTIKDIDIAVSRKTSSLTVSECFKAIESALKIDEKNIIKRGESQTSFYINSASGEWQVDLWFVEQKSLGAAILFATGCADFNVEMRGWLKARGMKLNRYGLYEVGKTPEEDVLLASATEEGIFKALGLEWVPPPERIHFDPHRKVKANGNESSNISSSITT